MPADQIGSSDATSILFGPFALNVAQRALRKADDVIPLGGRAFDILLALLDRPGEIVSKADLIARVWPDVTVEEGSLRVHLSALRKALGDGPRQQVGSRVFSGGDEARAPTIGALVRIEGRIGTGKNMDRAGRATTSRRSHRAHLRSIYRGFRDA